LEVQDYLQYALPVLILELLAALAGCYYLKKIKNKTLVAKAIVAFIWFTFFVEIIGMYAPIAYFTNYECFSFLENTPFARNNWMYNLYSIITYVFFLFYFRLFLKNRMIKRGLVYLAVIFVLTSIINLAVTDVYFKAESKYINLVGTFILFFCIILFFFELLRSNLILNLKRFLPIYIAIGVLVFYLCVTPLSIFSEYFRTSTGNKLFVELQVRLLLYSNIFMYSFFIIGFIICSKKRKYS